MAYQLFRGAMMFEMHEPVYRRAASLASGIPLGGLGTGCVEIREDGRFHEWEIFNNFQWSGDVNELPPDLWSEDAFFALRVQFAGQGPKLRLLYDDDRKMRSAAGPYDHAGMYNFPFLRNIPSITYSGQYPFARLVYQDPHLPVDVGLEAFTPFIPFNARDSALPLAFFVFTVRNRGEQPCELSLMSSFRNCCGYDQEKMTLRHTLVREPGLTAVNMTADDIDPAGRTAGTMAVAALDPSATYMLGWTDGTGRMGFPNPAAPALCQLFYPFRDTGTLSGGSNEWHRAIARRPLTQPPGSLHFNKRQIGWRWRGAVCSNVTLQPGESRQIVFMLTWFFPNHYHYSSKDQNLGHMYANWFDSAGDVARYGAANFGRLRDQSRAFCDSLYHTSLPQWLAASLNAQLTTFPQAFWWTRSGELLAWEGMACCQLIPAAHTQWSSSVPLVFFPELYLNMKRRMAAFGSGKQQDATDSPSVLAVEKQFREAAEQGQRHDFGGWFDQRFKKEGYPVEAFEVPADRKKGRSVLRFAASPVQVLRDYLWTGDKTFLVEFWPFAHNAIEAGLSADSNDDGLQDGSISWLTYDHWFPPAVNCYKATLWLADLLAAARIAELVGDAETSERYRDIAAKGSATVEKLLWNGEYYNFAYDFVRNSADHGCLADQVSGQLYLRLCGLPTAHPGDHVRQALAAVRRYNCTDQEGMLNGADPNGRVDWRYFARFSERGDDEALGGQWVTPWTGTEYYVAAVMAGEGMIDEAFHVAKDVYDRHVSAGMLYNHIECGEHYFRAFAIWLMLPALQGLVYDRAEASLAFAPKATPENHKSLLMLPWVFGQLVQRRDGGRQTTTIHVHSGELPLETMTLELHPATEPRSVEVQLDGAAVASTFIHNGGRITIRLDERINVRGRIQIAVT